MLASSNAIAQQGFGTNRPHKSAAVHIESPNKGLLIPRVSLTSDTDVTTIKSPANSLLIYNNNEIPGTLRKGYYYFDETAAKWIPFLDASNNTVTAANGLKMDGNTVKLGGLLTENTLIHANGKQIRIQGLTLEKNLTGKVAAIGDAIDGFVQVAEFKDIVTAGIENSLTSKDNEMTSVVNGDSQTATIINKNELTVATTATTNGSVDEVNLTSDVNGIPATVDIKPAIQAGQIKYELTSTGKTVDITTAAMVDNVIKINLETDVNDGIVVGNGIEKDATGKVILGGKLEKATTIITDNNPIMIQGLSQVNSMTGQMIAVGDYQSGEVKVASPKQIVDAGISVKNGISIDATDGAVKLGGALTEITEIDATSYELALKGVKSGDITQGTVLMHDTASNAIRSTLAGAVVGSGLINGSGTNVELNASSVKTAVHLGGKLTKNAVIETTPANGTVPGFSLAITGLEKTNNAFIPAVTLGKDDVLQQTVMNTGVQITSQSDDYTATINDETILVDTDEAIKKYDPNDEDENPVKKITITLPLASEFIGKRFHIKSIAKNHKNILSITSASAIDGSTEPIESSSPYQSWLLQSNGSEWFVIGY